VIVLMFFSEPVGEGPVVVMPSILTTIVIAVGLAATVVLGVGHGRRVLPGAAVLLGAGWSFLDSHIFWPRGVWTMVAMAAGFALWWWAVARISSVPVNKKLLDTAYGGSADPRHPPQPVTRREHED